MRDQQRQRVYDAEDQVGRQLAYAAAGARIVEVAGSTVVVPLEVRFGTLAAAGAYAERVRTSPSFVAAFPRAAAAPLRVRSRRGDRRAGYEAPGTIALHAGEHGSGWALRELVVLHEVAHHAVHHDGGPGPAHGPAFAAAMVRLVGEVMGAEVGLLLTAAYADHGVVVEAVAA